MDGRNYQDLAIFVQVAREGSFTKAAHKLGVTPSALSQTIRALEDRLGMALLARTTRNLAPTEVGERLLLSVGPRLQEIEAELASLHDLKEEPAGTIRITTSEHPAEAILWPVLETLLREHPGIRVEISTDGSLTDIVAERYDAGIRLGEQVAKDMTSVRIAPDMRMAVVASPSYFARHPIPRVPQDLASHDCINIRMPTSKGLSVWEFEKDGRVVNLRVEGRTVFNSGRLRLRAALGGVGLAYLLEDHVQEHIDAGRLVRVLSDWCEPFPGYHLYYPSRRLHSPAFALVVDALRYRR